MKSGIATMLDTRNELEIACVDANMDESGLTSLWRRLDSWCMASASLPSLQLHQSSVSHQAAVAARTSPHTCLLALATSAFTVPCAHRIPHGAARSSRWPRPGLPCPPLEAYDNNPRRPPPSLCASLPPPSTRSTASVYNHQLLEGAPHRLPSQWSS